MNSDHCQWFHPNCCLTWKQLEYLSTHITDCWKRVLIYLDVDQYTIDALEEDSRVIYQDSKEVSYQALLRWYQSNPKKAAFCKLKEALSNIERKDIIQDFQKRYPLAKDCTEERRKSFNSKFFVGREDERLNIIEFCQIENKDQLLVISALPGLGKTTLVKKALDDDKIINGKLQVLYPTFIPTIFEKDESSLENFAAALYEQLNPGEVITQNRMATLYNFLANVITEATVLIFDVSFITLPDRSVSMFWTFVSKVLSKNTKLKIIVLCCKTPDYYSLKVRHISLKEMLQEDAVKILRHQNSSISINDCNRLFKSCGGNPCILRKIAAHISNFRNMQEELNNFMKELERNPERERLQVFIQQSFLKNDMKLVFEQLEQNEKETLICLSNFPGLIPIFLIDDIFSQNIKGTAEHLWQNHCILERTDCGQFYQMSEITRSFVKSHCRNHRKYEKFYRHVKYDFIMYYLKLVSELDDVFLSPDCHRRTNIVFKMIERYRDNCKICLKKKCRCEMIQILFILFQKIKSVFLLCVKNGLEKEETILHTTDVCCKVFQFLRNILADEELKSMFEMLYTKMSEIDDKTRIAFTISNLVFTKAYHKVKHEKSINIKYISDVIAFFESELENSDKDMYLQLALCYINRGYLKGFYDQQFRSGLEDLNKGRNMLSKLPLKGRVRVALCSVSGYLAALYYQSGQYGMSIQEREKQVDGYRETLGIHPFTAKAMHYQGQAYGKVKDRNSGINCCLISYQMYRKLKGNGVETMRVLSTIGKLLLKDNRIKQGIRTLEKATTDGRNALGEHQRVAWCYDQLIKAKEDLGDDPSIIEELKQTRDNIQAQYNTNYEMQEERNAKTYVIQKSVDDINVTHILKKDEMISMSIIVPLLVVAVVIRLLFADILDCYCL